MTQKGPTTYGPIEKAQHMVSKQTARKSIGGKAPQKELAKKAPRISKPATASLSGKGHCLLNTINWLYPWAEFKSIHFDASIDSRLIQDPFGEYHHNQELPLNSTGGRGGFYTHSIRMLFVKDGRFPNMTITNMLSYYPYLNDPVQLMRCLVKTAKCDEKFILAGIIT
ncbi:hypothetical protein HDV02_005979 [Globomyces sp. JEL0801]|nr:hypothetical protein HDV02_005979 [Globomyces sp. JEL0801]